MLIDDSSEKYLITIKKCSLHFFLHYLKLLILFLQLYSMKIMTYRNLEQTDCPVTGSVTKGRPDSQHCAPGAPAEEEPPGLSAPPPGRPAPGESPPPLEGDEPEPVVVG
nr:unnamed protein product [Callosobruchus analis]